MTQETRSVEEILNGWNKPSVDNSLAVMLGDRVPTGDGRATAAHGTGEDDLNPVEFEKETYTGSDWKKADLEAEIEKRNDSREDEDDHIVVESGLKDDMITALVEDDEWLESLGGPDEGDED